MSISEVIGEGSQRFVANDCGDDSDAGEDVLSLCDLPLYGDTADYENVSSSSSSGDELFEFSPVWDSRDILFCGKLVPMLVTSNPSVGDRTDQAAKRNKPGVTKKARVISYSSARCDKWYMLAFGLARFPSEMALSEIRRRQGKGNPTRRKKGGSVWEMLKLKLNDLGSSRRDGAVVKAYFGCFS